VQVEVRPAGHRAAWYLHLWDHESGCLGGSPSLLSTWEAPTVLLQARLQPVPMLSQQCQAQDWDWRCQGTDSG
jgi:hypothetical protein